MKVLSFLLLALFISPANTKEYSSTTEVYTITIPDSWNVKIENKKTEIYFKSDAFVGQFEIAVRPFLAKTNAKSEFYGLKEDYPDANLTRINEIAVVICTLIDDGSKQYNWIFYHGKYEVWCLYTAADNSDHGDEIKMVETAINTMQFFELD